MANSPTPSARARPRPSTPLRFLRGVGPERATKLAAAGFLTVEDLLFHLPLRYEDRRRVAAIGEIDRVGEWTVRGALEDVRVIRTRRRSFSLVRARLVDSTGSLPVTWFNQPYLAKRLAAGETWLLHGPVRGADWGLWEMVNPSCEAESNARPAGPIVPVYPRLAGLGAAAVARLVAGALPALEDPEAAESLPEWLRRRYALPELAAALRALHSPAEEIDLQTLAGGDSLAHRRLIYGELLEFQLHLARSREREVGTAKRHRYAIDDRARRIAREILPFALTGAQKRVVREIVEDLRGPSPMLRLLQGDVGSGKTIVAALCLLLAAESGLQAAFMAPTELLAEQHHGNLRRLLGSRYRIELLTSSSTSAAARRGLADGEIQIAVGTHALIQQGVSFARLGLAVIDEQHRFGVEQRRSLQSKGDRPDILVMTATPIPRTLALTLYGDLEISQLDEMPPGRGELATEVVPAGERRAVYRRLRAALETGAQAYVVFPLIEENEELSAASLSELGDRVRGFLSEHSSAVLHGRLPAAERERIMQAFAAGRIRVLIATTVIEVGVDVPNASWMIIESAERFGLAQLHQLRGRVGRGARASTCVAIHGRLSEEGERRLAIFGGARDGFAIAEADLAIRGPGDLLGTRQAGMPRFRVADLATHRAWIERARQDARELLPRLGDPELAALARRVESRAQTFAGRLAGG